MEGEYVVRMGTSSVGKVWVRRQGLYYRFRCRCRLPDGGICRLWIQCGNTQENLGVLVPMGDGYGVDTQIPVKRVGEGEPDFQLKQKRSGPEGQMIPVYPEEPFAYIARLKEGYLVRKNGQTGIAFR